MKKLSKLADKNYRILIVDDMSVVRKILTKILNNIGIESIIEADDGMSGWRKVEELKNKNETFDLIISDWNMMGTTGIEFLQMIREDDLVAQTPFIILSAETDAKHVKMAIQAGANGFISKPFTQLEIYKKLLNILEKK